VLTRPALAVVLLAAAVLRLAGLTAVGLNSDETVYSGQAAAIAGNAVLSPLFPIFRAHPMLAQTILSVPFTFGISDEAPRIAAVVTGMATLLVVYAVASSMYSRLVGVLAACFMALMPYHVIVSRQFLLDGPMTLMTTFCLLMLARFAALGRAQWFYAAAAVLGLAVLTKETAIVFLGATYAFLALTPEVTLRPRNLGIGMLVMSAVIACFPISLALAGGGGASSAQQYLVWQLFRRPNHDLLFYPTVVPPAVGPLLLLAAAVAVWVFRRQFSWRERLLLSWFLVPISFFEFWPTKGFQYLLPAAPVVAILGARLLVQWRPHVPPGFVRVPPRFRFVPRLAVIGVVAGSLLGPAGLVTVGMAPVGHQLAGAGGIAGGREAGEWIDSNAAAEARIMTIGPSMANILQFYGHRDAQALSVSHNPLNRNPSYEPIINPDLSLRRGEFRYLVWDSYSAARTEHFTDRLLELIARYEGRLVHTEILPSSESAAGTTVIQIYEVGG
jgi:hypothetical protein